MTFQGLIIQILSGISTGMVIFLIAVGLSLVFGTLRILNLAHGALYMLGAYMCYWISSVVVQSQRLLLVGLTPGPIGRGAFRRIG